MPEESGSVGSTARRKNEHLSAALQDGITSRTTTGLERWRLRHRALPGLDLADVDLGVALLGRTLKVPLLISSMTGGSPAAATVNRNLAAAAQHHGIALALGSMRAALEDPKLADTYSVRDVAPDVPLLANVGVANLKPAPLGALCAHLDVDGLVIHLNALQEAIQPEGHAAFARALDAIGLAVQMVGVPVIVKEVGFGLSPEDIRALLDAGVAGIDVAGAGGTNWALVEGARDPLAAEVAAAFGAWGWPTAETLQNAVALRDAGRPGVLIIGSGGISDGVDAAKVLCLGADLAGVGRRLLAGAVQSSEAADAAVGVIVRQLKIAAFATGAKTRRDLGLGRIDSLDQRRDPRASA